MTKEYTKLQNELKEFLFMNNEKVDEFFADNQLSTPELLFTWYYTELVETAKYSQENNTEALDEAVKNYYELTRMPFYDIIKFNEYDGGKKLSVQELKDYLSELKEILKS